MIMDELDGTRKGKRKEGRKERKENARGRTKIR